RAHTCRCTSRPARKRRRAAVRGGQFAPPSPASTSSTFAASSECSSTVRGCHHAPAAINRTAATLRRLNSSDSRLPAEVALDRIPELLGEIERLRGVPWVWLHCRRAPFRDDEVIQQHVQGFGLHHRSSRPGGLALASRLEV